MGNEGLQDFLFYIVEFINFTIIPLLFALALLFFMFNVVRFFVLGSGDEKKREQAKQLAIYGLAAFVLLVSIWGIVNVITRSLDLDYQSSFCPDYMGNWCRDSNDSYNYGSPYDPFGGF